MDEMKLMRRKAVKDSKTHEQLSFDDVNVNTVLTKRVFDLKEVTYKKFYKLSEYVSFLKHHDVVWASRIEEFYLEHEYLTEKQHAILDGLIEKYAMQFGLTLCT